MDMTPLRSYRHEFTRSAQWRQEEQRRVLDHINRKEEKDRERERDRVDDHDALMDFAFGIIIATDDQIAAFTVKLDTYDAATIEALMENEEALEQAREKVRIMLDKAYVLPDGRRVFKTEDGIRVFDEHGEEVKDFDADLIEDWRPHWEEFDAGTSRLEALEAEREQLIEYQRMLDEAREYADKEGLSEAELEELERGIEEKMPEAVKRQLAEETGPAHEQDASPESPAQQATFQPAGKLDAPSI